MPFTKLLGFQLEYAPQYTVKKYISSRTGLQLVHVDHKSSPLVEGYFVVPTECVNDSGAPHTLEHLVFMGSQQYPYKGLLDTAGNLCMSSTNAWTATDQTVYTLKTAGWKGFQSLLPVYLDHVLHPTITDEACLTEVYHVDPELLTDKGVVFSEMEAIESQSWFVTMLEKQRLLFPEGSGYRSETGGLTARLRDLTNEEIRDFHKKCYAPENLCLIICGHAPEDQLLDVLTQWDNSLPETQWSSRRRPFIDSPKSQIPDKRDEVIESVVRFPELDESQGEILISWIGEQYRNFETDLAVNMLMDYFTETALAPFTKQMVEIEDPLANSVDYWTDDFMKTIINLGIHGVPTSKLQEAKQKALDILNTHQVDLQRMQQVIETAKWDYVLRCEKNGNGFLSQIVITDFIYGEADGSSLQTALKDLKDFDSLSRWSQSQWQSLLNRIFNHNRPVIVVGKPSSALYTQLEDFKIELIEKRKLEYGSNGKADLKKALEDAKLANETPIPASLLAKFEISNPARSVEFISTKSILTYNDNDDDICQDASVKRILDQKPTSFPLFFHLEHFPSQFLELHLLLNTTVVKDVELLPYYHIFDELFSMPMLDRDGNVISYEDVVSKLKSETVDSQISLGLAGSIPDLIDIRIRCRSENYSHAVRWIEHCLFDMVFDEKRVAVLLENYLNSIVELKREGDVMLESLTTRHLFKTRSMQKSIDPIYSESIIEGILSDIEDGKFEAEVLPRLETMRTQLRSNFSKFHLLLLGDMEKIPDIFEPWSDFVSKLENTEPNHGVKIPPVPRPLATISSLCQTPRNEAHIITTPASESSYLNVITSAPFNLDYRAIDFPIVCLASEYLQCVEGPFWKGIRGSGLAYDASMVRHTEINAWGFSIYRGADICECYEVGKQIIEDYAEGIATFDPQLLQGAKSSIINKIATMENGYFASALNKYTDNILKRRGPEFNKYFLEKISKVTIEQLQYAMKKYLVNLFDPEKSVVFVSCHPSKAANIQEFLERKGFDVSIEELEDDDNGTEDSDSD